MEPKKKNFLDNIRTKLPILKKPGKKQKQGKKLAHRRSISVPDLSMLPTVLSAADKAKSPAGLEGVSSETSSGQSDSDSVASGSYFSGPLFGDRLTVPESPQVIRQKVPSPAEHITHRASAPADMKRSQEEGEGRKKVSGAEVRFRFSDEPLYIPVNKPDRQVKGNILASGPTGVPKSRSTPVIPVGPAMSVDKIVNVTENIPSERGKSDSGGISAALARASSFGDQVSQSDKAYLSDWRKPPSGKRTPPVSRANVAGDRWSLSGDGVGAPADSVDGTSLDSTCGTPTDEAVSMPWTTDSDDQEQEGFGSLISEIFTMQRCNQLQGSQFDLSQVEGYPDDALESEQNDTFPENAGMVAGPGAPASCGFQRYLLNLNLKRGKNLVIRNKRGGTSDPYVKFKLEGRQFYKSKVVYKNLNPHWNEHFSHPLRERDHPVEVRVYDKNRTADEFMGSSTIALNNLELYKTYEMELRLTDSKSKEGDMGLIYIDVCLMNRDATIKKPRWPQKKVKNQALPTSPTQKNQGKSQLWNGVYSISLVEGLDLPQYGQGDVSVRFRLGEQKYKSKNLCIQANPQWREKFEFNQFADSLEPLQVEVSSKRGRKGEELWGLFDIDLSRLPENERQLYTHVLNPGMGRLVFLVTLRPCWGVSIGDISAAPLDQPDEKDLIIEKFCLKNSHQSVREVGFLQVKVIKATDVAAADLHGKSDPFCVVELGNSRLQTQTVYKTQNPEWHEVLTFPIKDIHDVLEVTVQSENGDKATFCGKVSIPLLTVKNGQQTCLSLKKQNLLRPSKGTITLEMEIIYNRVRAGIKTFQPKEVKFVEDNLKFSKKVLAQNIYRVRKISTAVLYTLQYIKSCFQWESTQRSLIAFLIFLVTVWHFELFMLPLFLLLLVGWNYFQISGGGSNQDLVNMNMADDEEEDDKESGKKGLMEKIHMVQEIVITVQNILDEIANIGERIKNTFNWSVPFLSCLACLVLFVGTLLMYYIPLRYIIMIWGVNKFTKKLRNPHGIDNNEILDFLKRVPSDVQKVQYSELRTPAIISSPRKRR